MGLSYFNTFSDSLHFKYLPSFLFVILFFTTPNTLLLSQSNDFEISKSIKFIIEGDEEDGFELSSEEKFRIKYLTKRSTNKNQFYFFEDFTDEIVDFKAQFRLEKFHEDDLYAETIEREDLFITDDKVFTLSLPNNISSGEQLTYQLEREYSSIEYLPIIRIPNEGYIKSFKILIEKEEEIDIDFEIIYLRDSLNYKSYVNEDSQTVIEFSNISESDNLSFTNTNSYHAFIFLVLKIKDKLLTPTTAKTFCDWYSSLTDITPNLDSTDYKLLPPELFEAKTDIEKLEIIHKFITENFRYVFEGIKEYSFIPKKPSVILKNKYGDCKERAALFSAIAATQNIKVNMICVPRDEVLGSKNINISVFNHVICGYETAEGYLFFDPTAKYVPFQNIPDNIIGKRVLFLDETNPRFLIVKSKTKIPNIEIVIDADLDSLNYSKAKIIFRGDHYAYVKKTIEEHSDKDFENIISNFTNLFFQKLSFENFVVENIQNQFIELSASANLENFIINSNSKTYIPLTPFSLMDRDILTREKDNFPIVLSYRNNYKLTIICNSKNYNTLPQNISIGDSSAPIFYNTYLVNNNEQFEFHYDIVQSEKVFQYDKKEYLLNFARQYYGFKNELYILKGVKNEESIIN